MQKRRRTTVGFVVLQLFALTLIQQQWKEVITTPTTVLSGVVLVGICALVGYVPVAVADETQASTTTLEEQCEEETCQETQNEKKEEQFFDKFGKWFDDVNTAGVKLFMKENVLQSSSESKSNDDNSGGLAPGLLQAMSSIVSGRREEHTGAAVETILEQARRFSMMERQKRNLGDIFDLFKTSFIKILDSFDKSFGHVNFQNFQPLAFLYYIEKEDEVKNPTWKRRQHRYLRNVDTNTVMELHNYLYLAHLSYVDTIEQVREGLEPFVDDWELVHCEPGGLPGQPAHFIALKKEHEQQPTNLLSWMQEPKPLEVVVVIRGTKEIGDMITDALLEASDYRGGKTHSGVAQGGKYLVDKHMNLMHHLLDISDTDKIKLTLVGHSLGAGAAAIAAIEFNEYDNIDATAIGFGCPAMLSKELSERTKDYITTVVVDSDVVPRMSGATVANMFLDLMSFDWTKGAMEDLKQLLQVTNDTIPLFDVPQDNILDFMDSYFDKTDRVYMNKVPKERLIPELIPPGTCIHIYRDGVGFSGSYTPCDFFNAVDVTRTMLLDHLADAGYHRAFLQFVRDRLDDLRFDFQHDLIGLPV